ncbi:glutathione S-transferase theta-3-like [Babylonia areolata]|uniref:glutathione S-transferase theta-3-like n=1 Tax=Babylonia areolata TaxID=304850 RepID=UPI003FD0EEB6
MAASSDAGDSILNASGSSHTLAKVKQPLELYLIRISPPCRAVWMYLLQHNIPHVLIDVNFSSDSLDLPDALRQQPHREVPLLVDGAVVVFEGPAILNYLATTYTHHAGFGQTAAIRHHSESLCCWANSQLHRAVGFGYIYPQFLEKYALPGHDHNEAMTEHALRDVTHQLEALEQRYLATNNPYLTGNRQTVADLYVATVLVQMEWTGFRFKLWPKVDSWLTRVRHAEFWDTVHQSHQDFVAELERNRYMFD